MDKYLEVFGAIVSPPDIRDYRIASTSLNQDFPITYELDMPAIKNQGPVSSCVAHAICTVAEYYNKQQYNIDNPLSPGYIYGNRVPPLGTTKGMAVRYAIANFCKDGAPFLTDFPLHCEVPKIIEEVEKAKPSLHEQAIQCRFTDYIKVETEREMKTALLNGHPIIIAIDWYKDMIVKKDVITSKLKDRKNGHALVIYGWNEKGWKIQNSWGDLWALDGKAIWPYDYKIREAYIIIDNETSSLQIKKPYSVNTPFGKWCVKIINNIYAFFTSIKYYLS